MADIELVIKIPKEQYNAIKSDLYNTFSAEMKIWGLGAIRNGTPLPKGHGRLIDADAYAKKFNTNINGRIDAEYVIAPTIIEADKESEK